MITNLNEKECVHLLATNYLGYLSYIYNNEPFVVPITYFYDGKDAIICYSSEGHKTRALRLHHNISLITAAIQNLNNWTSVQAQGICEEMKGSSIKACIREFTNGIKKIAHQKEGLNFEFLNEFSHKSESAVSPTIFKIHVTNLFGKAQNSE